MIVLIYNKYVNQKNDCIHLQQICRTLIVYIYNKYVNQQKNDCIHLQQICKSAIKEST